MTDTVDPKTRSRMMAGVRGKDTKPELVFRRALHARGFRYRLHSEVIKGKPDLVLQKYRAVILVHGCFWHRHSNCRYASTPSTRKDFWNAKFDANLARDAATKASLLDAGWRVATIWGCALRKPQQVESTAGLLAEWLAANVTELEIGEHGVISPGSSMTTSR